MHAILLQTLLLTFDYSASFSFKIQLINLPILSLLISSAFAADCFGPNVYGVGMSLREAYSEAREKMCANKLYDYQKGCATCGNKSLSSLKYITVNLAL